MTKFQLILLLFALLQEELVYVLCTNGLYNERSSVEQSNQPSIQDTIPGKDLLSILGKSRQSRCVRCYENRNYEDRGRIPTSGSAGYGRFTDDRASNWYYPSNDRGEDRYRDFESSRYDRYTPRNEGRDYERGYDYRGYDRYDDRRGSYYDRNDARGNGNLGYYGASQRAPETYYDRNAARPVDYGYDRDYYDRYNTRYDLRNYRPLDESYRGQSGFDNTGRGYYFATEDDRSYTPTNDRRYLPENDPRYFPDEDRRYLPENDRRYAPQDDRRYLPQDDRRSSPCGSRVANCPYDSSRPGMGHINQISSGPINSNSASPNSKGSNIVNKDDDNNKNDPKGSPMRGSENQERDRQESSPYGGRPPRPLGGSYLFDRENNAIVKDDHYNEGLSDADKNEASNDVKNNNKK